MRLVVVLTVLCIIATVSQVESGGGRRGNRHHHRHRNATTPQPRNTDCPAIECPDQSGICPYGPNQDENLCPLCGCRPSRRCGTRPMCLMACPNGFENGPDGCPTCRCYTPSLTPVLLQSSSDSTSATTGSRTSGAGRHRGRDHHQHSHDGRQPQQQPSVEQNARFKSAADATEAPSVGQLPSVMTTSTDANRTSTRSECPPMCLMFCEHGLKRGSDGCPLCECNSEAALRRRSWACTRPVCAMFCENGFRTDSRGCTICQCFEPGTSTGVVASAQQCPRLRCHTSRRCAFGFEVDQDTGCQGCNCRQTSGA